MKELLREVIIPHYCREIVVSNSVRPKHYEKENLKKSIPKKYQGVGYYWVPYKVIRNKKRTTVHFLVGPDGEKVVSNPRVANTPRTKIINGQDLHKLTLPTYMAAKIKQQLKKQFSRHVRDMEPVTQKPLIVECELFDTIDDVLTKGSRSWDVDNRFLFYGKVFLDVLTGCPVNVKGHNRKTTTKVIIPDDNREYVTGPPSVLFTPIRDKEDRKLVFRIYHDQRPKLKRFGVWSDNEEIKQLFINFNTTNKWKPLLIF